MARIGAQLTDLFGYPYAAIVPDITDVTDSMLYEHPPHAPAIATTSTPANARFAPPSGPVGVAGGNNWWPRVALRPMIIAALVFIAAVGWADVVQSLLLIRIPPPIMDSDVTPAQLREAEYIQLYRRLVFALFVTFVAAVGVWLLR